MEFKNKFHVPLPLEEAWQLMLDVPRILPCLPGARLTEVIGDDKYRGAVQVKLGPVKLAFEGEAEMVRKDHAAHVAWLKGSGLDPKGRGSAQSEFSFALQPAAGGTDVTVTTNLQLSGAVAQYGRGSGMIAEVAAQILDQFEENLAEMLMEDRGAVGAQATHGTRPALPPGLRDAGLALASTGGAPGARDAAAPLPAQSQLPAAPMSQDMQALYYQAQALLAQSQSVLAATSQALAEFRTVSAVAKKNSRKKELNGFGLLWRAARSSMFGKGTKA
jgi:carbon monoxide dehydrogenase subunit G